MPAPAWITGPLGVVVGDGIRMGSAELVVREIEEGKVTRVGLRIR